MSRNLRMPLGSSPTAEPRATVTAVVALGANLGDREATLENALAELRRLPLVDEVTASTPIESVALTLDGPDESEPAYLNAVALVRTRLAPSVLLGMLHAIEARHGRERREKWGARTLDLDLIAYGDVVSEDERLQLPHRARRARLRPRSLARGGSGCRPPRSGPRRRPPGVAARRRRMTRTSPLALIVAAVLGGGVGFLVDHLLTLSGRPTFSPAVGLPILLVLLGAITLALAWPVRRSVRSADARGWIRSAPSGSPCSPRRRASSARPCSARASVSCSMSRRDR